LPVSRWDADPIAEADSALAAWLADPTFSTLPEAAAARLRA
jgi:hypothetical protein